MKIHKDFRTYVNNRTKWVKFCSFVIKGCESESYACIQPCQLGVWRIQTPFYSKKNSKDFTTFVMIFCNWSNMLHMSIYTCYVTQDNEIS